MTNVFFRHGRCLGTDEDYYGNDYDDSELIHGLPRDFEPVGKTKEVVIRAAEDYRTRRRNSIPTQFRQPVSFGGGQRRGFARA
jgi:hypothetical protein